MIFIEDHSKHSVELFQGGEIAKQVRLLPWISPTSIGPQAPHIVP